MPYSDRRTALEADGELAALVDRLAEGETITITKQGIPTAVLTPVTQPREKLSHEEIVEGFRALRKRVKPDTMSIREMIDEGRRF